MNGLNEINGHMITKKNKGTVACMPTGGEVATGRSVSGSLEARSTLDDGGGERRKI